MAANSPLSARLLAALAASAVPVRTALLVARVGGRRSSVWRALAALRRRGVVAGAVRRDDLGACRCPTCGRRRAVQRETFWSLTCPTSP